MIRPSAWRTALLLFLLVSCASLPEADAWRDWSLEDYRSAGGSVVVIDLRTPPERALGQFSGARGVDYWSSDFERFLREADRSPVYLVYCAHGVRGRQAVARMRQAGFTEAHNLAGGVAGWKEFP